MQQLEQGDLSLDDALQQFERGVALARASQQQLQSGRAKGAHVAATRTTMNNWLLFSPPAGD